MPEIYLFFIIIPNSVLIRSTDTRNAFLEEDEVYFF